MVMILPFRRFAQPRKSGAIDELRQRYAGTGTMFALPRVEFLPSDALASQGFAEFVRGQPEHVRLQSPPGVECHVSHEIVAKHEIVFSVLTEAEIPQDE